MVQTWSDFIGWSRQNRG